MIDLLRAMNAKLDALVSAEITDAGMLRAIAIASSERSNYVKCKRCKLETIEGKLDAVIGLLQQVLKREGAIMKELDDLEKQVKANTDAEQSAIVLLGKLHDLLVAAGTDPAKLKKLADDLNTSKTDLAAAVVANTPAENPPTP